MQTQSGPARPRAYGWVAVLALVWNLVGAAMFWLHVTMDPARLATLGEADQAVYLATPPWVTENRPNIAPPRFSVPIVPEFPGPPDPDAPPAPQAALPPAQQAAPAPAGPPLPAEAGAPAPAGQVQQQSASVFGGTVGPVGSQSEKDQLSQIVGGPATSAQQLLLAPVVRGSDVQVTSAPEAQR